jgi:tRNA(fMet)-specific endonuclease VapC
MEETNYLNAAIIDTDIFSEMIKAANPVVAGHASTYRAAFSRYTISTVTLMEIIRGYQQKQASRQLQSFLVAIASEEVLSFDQAAARLAGTIGGELARTGTPIGLADTMIAAIALTHGLELVTGNTAHFQHVQQLGYPLTVVNWRI